MSLGSVVNGAWVFRFQMILLCPSLTKMVPQIVVRMRSSANCIGPNDGCSAGEPQQPKSFASSASQVSCLLSRYPAKQTEPRRRAREFGLEERSKHSGPQ